MNTLRMDMTAEMNPCVLSLPLPLPDGKFPGGVELPVGCEMSISVKSRGVKCPLLHAFSLWHDGILFQGHRPFLKGVGPILHFVDNTGNDSWNSSADVSVSTTSSRRRRPDRPGRTGERRANRQAPTPSPAPQTPSSVLAGGCPNSNTNLHESRCSSSTTLHTDSRCSSRNENILSNRSSSVHDHNLNKDFGSNSRIPNTNFVAEEDNVDSHSFRCSSRNTESKDESALSHSMKRCSIRNEIDYTPSQRYETLTDTVISPIRRSTSSHRGNASSTIPGVLTSQAAPNSASAKQFNGYDNLAPTNV